MGFPSQRGTTEVRWNGIFNVMATERILREMHLKRIVMKGKRYCQALFNIFHQFAIYNSCDKILIL